MTFQITEDKVNILEHLRKGGREKVRKKERERSEGVRMSHSKVRDNIEFWLFNKTEAKKQWLFKQIQRETVSNYQKGPQNHPQFQWLAVRNHRNRDIIIFTATIYKSKGYKKKVSKGKRYLWQSLEDTRLKFPRRPLPEESQKHT